MDVDLRDQVKQSYADTFLKTEYPGATADDVTFTRYLGTYNGSFVAVLNDKSHWLFEEFFILLEVDGLNFSYSNGYPIRVWNDGVFYDLGGAYGAGLLTRGNLETIYNLYRNISE
ncbi:MAG: hypothetical protein FWE85_00185 [Clostridiales bacterium]|nr:hypothetical protein [Clostridiales bacterium]